MTYSPAAQHYGMVSPPDAENSPARNLSVAVAVLGLATFAFSFGPVTDAQSATAWFVRFAVLAGLLAAIGLLPRATRHPTAVAALAGIGFLDALATVLTTAEAGWALWVILVLNALQAIAATAALMMVQQPAADSTASYAAYVEYYNEAVRNYYGQQTHSAPPPQPAQGGQGRAYAEAQPTHAQRPSQRADYGDLNHTDQRPRPQVPPVDGPSAPEPHGLPTYGQTSATPQQPHHGGEQSAWPS